MPYFTPPSVLDNPPFDADTYDKGGVVWQLARWRLPMRRGLNVYLLSDGSYVQDVPTAENSNTRIPAYPLMPDQGGTPNLVARSINATGTPTEVDTTVTPYIVKVYWGGHKNPITAAEQTALTAYTAYGIGYGGDITNT